MLSKGTKDISIGKKYKTWNQWKKCTEEDHDLIHKSLLIKKLTIPL